MAKEIPGLRARHAIVTPDRIGACRMSGAVTAAVNLPC
jgi:hypothetical protein